MSSYHFICGGAAAAAIPGARQVVLELHGTAQNVNLRISDITRSMLANLPDLLLDLLDVAAYIYCADQQASRGTEQLTDYGTAWRRQMHFTIPVRQPRVWQERELRQTLTDTLEFLSDDYFDFTFVDGSAQLAPKELYFADVGGSGWVPDRVVLFSGGLDSLAGVISDVAAGERLALVGHHSAPKTYALQKQLVDELGQRGVANRLLYVPVNVTTKGEEPVEFTQRTRSFLFGSLATVVARLFDKDGFTFYENGVISLNLPIAGDVLGARATRTTHPRVIRGFEAFFSQLLGTAISIRTPFLWMTKAEVIAELPRHGYGGLIAKTGSCTRPRVWTSTQPLRLLLAVRRPPVRHAGGRACRP